MSFLRGASYTALLVDIPLPFLLVLFRVRRSDKVGERLYLRI